MRFSALAELSLVVLAGACSTVPDTADADPFGTLAFAPADAAAAQAPAPADRAPDAYSIEFRILRSTGETVTAPRITAFPGQRCNVTIARQVSYVADYDVEQSNGAMLADPVLKTLTDGLTLEACASHGPGAGATLGFSVRIAKLREPIAEFTTTLANSTVTIQLPEVDSVELRGGRAVEPGAWGLVGRVTSPDDSGPLLVLARVRPVFDESLVPSPGAAPVLPADAALSRPASGPAVRLRVAATIVNLDLEPGAVYDESAAEDLMRTASGRVLRDFRTVTCLDSRVRFAAGTAAPDASPGEFRAEMTDDGVLHLRWRAAGEERPREASLRPARGRSLVALARLQGGGSACALVCVDAD